MNRFQSEPMRGSVKLPEASIHTVLLLLDFRGTSLSISCTSTDQSRLLVTAAEPLPCVGWGALFCRPHDPMCLHLVLPGFIVRRRCVAARKDMLPQFSPSAQEAVHRPSTFAEDAPGSFSSPLV
jgi:hypothetical protein